MMTSYALLQQSFLEEFSNESTAQWGKGERIETTEISVQSPIPKYILENLLIKQKFRRTECKQGEH